MGSVRQNPIQRTVRSVHVCAVHCVHNVTQNRSDNFPSCPPDNHHCSDDVYLRERGCSQPWLYLWWTPRLFRPVPISLHANPAIIMFVDFTVSAPYLYFKTTSEIATSIVNCKLDYCNSFYYNPPKSQITRLQHPELSCTWCCQSS